jgi:uncharacterized membrane protein
MVRDGRAIATRITRNSRITAARPMHQLPAEDVAMYTKAAVARHPIHPMLVAFPVGLYTATVVALFAHVASGDPFWYRVAFWANLAGVVMAAVAAVPGLIDLLGLPAHSKARTTALRHAAFNVFALVMFVISAIILGRNWFAGRENLADGPPLVFGLIGLVSTVAAGALGWTLVQTHHVGVKPTQRPTSSRPREEIDDLDELVETPSVVASAEAAFPMH